MQKTKKVFIILFVVLVAGLSSIVANRYIFPHLATTKLFAKYDFLKKTAADVTVINKTEQVYVKEDTSISKVVGQALSSVVNVTSYVAGEKKNPLLKNGTGLIVTSDGLIMTYASAIIAENASYKVTTDNNNIYEATLLDIDVYSNLVFLKINASNLSAASFANSDDAQPGEKIIAVGNDSPVYAPSFAAGVLSSFQAYYNLSEKSVASSEKMEGVFSADLNTQEHFIGGPIVDYSGQIIGITGAVSRDNRANFFQIPANKVRLVIDKEIKKEIATTPVLGLSYLPLTKIYASINNLPSETGALIYSASGQQGLAIIANSPAANAGLKIGDIITAVAGEKIDANNTLPDLLYRHKKGEQLELTILRNTQEMKINVQL
ncbi:MAG: S1C family serine protease [Parcubacteria group bacterium]|jgi:serine protease Do